MLDFHLDAATGQAPYLQLVQQVKQALRLGWLQPGDKLPTVHEVAASVEAVGVGRRYGRFWALRDLTLQLPAGSITAVVGPNGAGKTTLLNLLVGLLPPSEGELRVVGQRPGNDPGFLAKVGFVAQ